MSKSMLNPPEREKYSRGKLVKNATKALFNLFGEDASEKQIKSKMEAVHTAVEKAPIGPKKADTLKQVAVDQDLTLQNVKDIEKLYAYKAGGGGKENIFGEVKQVLRAMTNKPTSGQLDAEDFGGARTTREARKKAGEAFIGGSLLGLGTGAGALIAWNSFNASPPPSEFKKAFSKAHNAGENTFMFKGKEYTTDVRKGKAKGGELGDDNYDFEEYRRRFLEETLQDRREQEEAEKERREANERRTAETLKEKMTEGEKRAIAEETMRLNDEAAERYYEDENRLGFDKGGLPDLTGDGKVTQADVLKGRGVFNEGSVVEESLLDQKQAFRTEQRNNFLRAGKSVTMAEMRAGFAADKKFGSDYSLMNKEKRNSIDKTQAVFETKEGTPEGEKSREEARTMIEERKNKAEGSLMMPVEGMPVDTYDNIPPEEMEEAMASQLPDDEMEDSYTSYVMDESLDDNEQEYLAGVLENDPRLSDILDKVITVASEFSGAGEVDGPGTGVSDSIPARLSDGEFVMTKKATDQLGADNLQVMMDDAERAYDGGYQMKAMGGVMDEEDPADPMMSKTQEEIEKLMMGANRMPSLQ